MKINNMLIPLLGLTFTSVVLIGCGGGSKPTEAISSNSFIGGTAAKGIVQQGIVNAYMLSPEGIAGSTSVGNAITKDDGSYSLELNTSYDGESALLLELTSDSTSTKMVCDALNGCGTTDRGGLLIPPSGFTLTTIIPAVDSDSTINAQITTFTHIAAKSIQSSSDTSSENIAKTTSRINQIVGTNILETSPVNITDSSDFSEATDNEQRYTIMLAAIAEQAFEDDNLVDNIDAIATDFSVDGAFGGENGLVMDDFIADIDELVTESEDELNDTVGTSLTQHTTILKDQTNDDGEYQPTETTGAGESDVAKAKLLITEIREWKESLEDLETPADAFTNEADVIIDTLDSDTNAVIEVLGRALSAAQSAINKAIDSEVEIPSSVTVSDRDGQTMGTISLTDLSSESSQGYSASSTDIAGVSLNAVINLNHSINNTTISSGDKTLKVNLDATNENTKIAFEDTMVTFTLAEEYVTDDDSSEEPNLSAISFSGGVKVEELASGEATGKLAMGKAEIKLVALDGISSIANDVDLSLEKIALTDLTVSSDSGSTTGLSVSLEMDNATKFDTFAYLENKSEIGFLIEKPLTDFNLDNIINDFGITTIDSLYYSSSSNNTCASGFSSNNTYISFSCQTLDVGNLKTQAMAFADIKYPQSYVSTSIDGVYWNSYEKIFEIDGVLKVDDIETATNFLDATLNITGSLDLANYPEAIITITADKTGIDKGNFTATLGYDGKSMQIQANTTNATEVGTSGNLSFENADGVIMKLNVASGNAVSGTVTVDDKDVGIIEESSSGIVLIRYNDGTFESL